MAPNSMNGVRTLKYPQLILAVTTIAVSPKPSRKMCFRIGAM